MQNPRSNFWKIHGSRTNDRITINLARECFSHYFLCKGRFARISDGLMRRKKRCKTGSIRAEWAKLIGVKASTVENDKF